MWFSFHSRIHPGISFLPVWPWANVSTTLNLTVVIHEFVKVAILLWIVTGAEWKQRCQSACYDCFLPYYFVREPDFPSVNLIFIHSSHISDLGKLWFFYQTALAIEIQRLSSLAIKWHWFAGLFLLTHPCSVIWVKRWSRSYKNMIALRLQVPKLRWL